ncbi:MAG: hypothetical protein KUG74_10915 [Rhodobacteraceae bacterium]|nr:hypothetical protein [Paracoccaceae bacterium]
MQNTKLLESIWKGDIFAANSRKCQEVTRLLGLILPLRTVPLSAKSGVSRSCIVSEHIELLPEIHLGDVLAEELCADVPFGAMIVIFKEHGWMESSSQANVSFELGLLIGDTLLNLIKDCVFPIQCEPEVLLVMVNSYCRLIESPEFQKQKVCCQSFREGVFLSLKEYWDGQPQYNLADHKRKDDKSRVSRHMKHMGSHVGKQLFGQKSINLTKLHSNVFNGNDWKKSISEAVMGEIHRDTVRVNNYYD